MWDQEAKKLSSLAALHPIIPAILFYDCYEPMQAFLSCCYGE